MRGLALSKASRVYICWPDLLAGPRELEDKHAAALEKTISKASDASNSGKDFSFGSDDVPPEVKDMSTGHAISA